MRSKLTEESINKKKKKDKEETEIERKIKKRERSSVYIWWEKSIVSDPWILHQDHKKYLSTDYT